MVQVAQVEPLLFAGSNACNGSCDLAGYEDGTAALPLVIEHSTGDGERFLGLMEVPNHPVRVELGDSVGRATRSYAALRSRYRGESHQSNTGDSSP